MDVSINITWNFDISNNDESLNLIYFRTITKQVIQLILIMLVGTDVCVRMVLHNMK